jgi:gas vesicle protein
MVKKLPIAALIGAAAGLVAGVLTAPKSGKETREDIKNKAEELKQKAVKAADDTKNAAKDKLKK